MDKATWAHFRKGVCLNVQPIPKGISTQLIITLVGLVSSMLYTRSFVSRIR